MRLLEANRAVVTGGARGIGKVISRSFVEEGARVLICSRSEDEMKKTCREIDISGKNIFSMRADVSVRTDCKSLIGRAIELFGGVDILVNNAGIYGPIGFLETSSAEDWENTIRINLLGTVFCSQEVLPQMKKQMKGKIINLAGGGVGGKNPLARFTAYYTSKMAVAGFTEVLAEEVKDENIQVNCISPGAIKTRFTDFLISQGEEKAGKVMYEQALKIRAEGGDSPELTAKMAVFLASSKGDGVSGKILSAKWDSIDRLGKEVASNLFVLRRIDDFMFYEKK